MNRCVFVGRTTKAAELRYTQGNEPLAVANVSIAVDEGFGDKKTTSFFDLVIWGKRAEAFEKNVPVGTRIAVECRAKQNKWKDKNGQNRYSINFHVDNWEYAQSKGESGTTDKNLADDYMDIDNALMEELPFN